MYIRRSFSAFRIQIQVSSLDMLDLDLNKLAHPCSGCGKKADDKIPKHFAITFQAVLEVLIISFADHILQERFLLHPHKGQFPFLLADALKVAVDRTKAQVNRLRFVVFNQPDLVRPQIFLRDFPILARCTGVLRTSMMPWCFLRGSSSSNVFQILLSW